MAEIALALLFLLLVAPADAALTVGAQVPEDLVSTLRRSIFVDASFLEERPAPVRCSSLDGPRCFGALQGQSFGHKSALAPLDGPGVVPDLLLQDLGSDITTGLSSPSYDALEATRRQYSLLQLLGQQRLAGPVEELQLRSARATAARGILHFAETEPDRRLPLSFSQGLPSGVVATWDGRWVAKHCSSDGLIQGPLMLELPHSDSTSLAKLEPHSTALATVVQLAGNLGYLRFSRPVLIRSLYGRWRAPEGAPKAMVGARRGLSSVWAAHLNPEELGRRGGWIDLAGGPLQPVDELAFFAMPGLEIAAVEVVAVAADDSEEHSALFLEPVSADDDEQDAGASSFGGFALSRRKVTAAGAPFFLSLQEVIERNLRLRSKPAPAAVSGGGLGARGAPVLGLLSAVVPATEITWAVEATIDEAMFQHRLQPLVLLQAMASKADLLPEELRREMARQQEAIREAVLAWPRGGNSTPRFLPGLGSEQAFQRYFQAKVWQTKLDLLTAGFLHLRQHLLLD